MRAFWALSIVLGCTPVDPITTAHDQAPAKQASVTVEPDNPVEPVESVEPTVADARAPVCLERSSFDSQRSVLSEQRARAGAKRWSDFATRYPAASIDPDADHPVELVAAAQIGATPLLWFTADYAEAFVNAAVLTELKVVDATGLAVGERVEIGALTELALGMISGRELASFLLEAGVIQTFVHIGSTVCLLAETEDADSYRAEFTGEHEYFTNGQNIGAFGFILELAADGGVAITGASAKPLPKPD
jgi:hypothetical protein